jgi:hypothetical protein
MWTGRPDVASIEQHIPERYSVILEPGDMVFNPVWMWHKITSKSLITIVMAPLRFVTLWYEVHCSRNTNLILLGLVL